MDYFLKFWVQNASLWRRSWICIEHNLAFTSAALSSGLSKRVNWLHWLHFTCVEKYKVRSIFWPVPSLCTWWEAAVHKRQWRPLSFLLWDWEKDFIACGILVKGLHTACDVPQSCLCNEACYTGNAGKTDRRRLFHLHYLHAVWKLPVQLKFVGNTVFSCCLWNSKPSATCM